MTTSTDASWQRFMEYATEQTPALDDMVIPIMAWLRASAEAITIPEWHLGMTDKEKMRVCRKQRRRTRRRNRRIAKAAARAKWLPKSITVATIDERKCVDLRRAKNMEMA